jgi:alpha-beta hydrolase superfamily lysophospholipase
MKAAFVLVAALLLGACQTDKLATKQADDPRPTSVNPIAKPKGPQIAKGAVLFINGIDGRNLRHHADEETPDILHWFAGGGFDVYRVDLAPKDQDPSDRVFAAMDRAIFDMRRQNYRRVYVVGQSAGGVAALVSTEKHRSVQSDGAIAIAVGGFSGNETAQINLQFHELIVREVTPATRVAVFHFRDDQILGRWHNEAVRISRSKLDGRRNAMVRVPPGVTGHYAMDTPAFVRTYGACLTQFLAADDPDGSICPP